MVFPKPALTILFLAGLLAGCAPATPQPTVTLSSSATPPPATATVTPSPTQTVTVTPTPSPSPTETITQTPTPPAAFDQLQILNSEAVVGGVRVTLALPGVSVAYKLLIRGYEYACTLDPQVQDRLFCFGLAQIPPAQTVPLVLQDPVNGEQIYVADVYYTGSFTATPESYASSDCPQRGEGANCEPECRQLPEGGYCVVATCSDACGIYFSVNTCPAEMSMDFNSCTEDQWAEAKLRYSIP
jgi:hypothetical protein